MSDSTCRQCRYYLPDADSRNRTGVCRSRRTQRRAARELEVPRHAIGIVLTYDDGHCEFFSAIAEVGDGKAD